MNKKILTGMLMTFLAPFVVILGYYTLSVFKVSDGAMLFASWMGGLSVGFNFIMGCLLIVRGYQDAKTFEGWG